MIEFPANPTHGTIFELAPGLVYQYDATINTWVSVVSSDIILPVATTIKPGAMTATDLQKLNRLVLPPPFSTITGNKCVTPFSTGALTLSGDEYLNVEGDLDIHAVDQEGDATVEAFPFQIHQHTFGFDFNVDIGTVISELERRDQFNIRGAVGERGVDGDRGEQGESNVATGPRGETGAQGTAPPCPYSAEVEPLPVEVKQGLRQALVGARVVVDPEDETKYSIEFDRQTIGAANASAYKFNVRQQRSSWVLAVTSAVGTAQPIYYVNLAPIINSVREKYISELVRLKTGYEDIVQFWVQTMSDLFDEQKRALCCALEYCQSKTKNTQLRQHLEMTAATIAGVGKIVINPRGSSETTESSGTGMLDDLPGGRDLCASSAAAVNEARIKAQAVEPRTVKIDPLTHIRPENGVKLDLVAGEYTVTIQDMAVQINNKHFMPVAIQYQTPEKPRSIKFLNKGHFDNLVDAKSAYNGLTLSFTHSGGQVSFFFNMFPTQKVSGSVTLNVVGAVAVQEAEIEEVQAQAVQLTCSLPRAKLEWYCRGWETSRCCGCVVNMGGQDFIIMKRSIGIDDSCGGGEHNDAPCIGELADIGHPAFAWPTLDGITPVPVSSDSISFIYDADISATAVQLIVSGSAKNYRGSRTQLGVVLFPAAQ